MNIKVVLCVCLVITMFSSVVQADYSTVVSYDYEATVGNTLSDTNGMVDNKLLYLYTDLVQNLDNVLYQEMIESGTDQFSGTGVSSSTFYGKAGGDVVCTGMAIFSGSSDGKHDRLSLYFDYWNMGALTGNRLIALTYSDGAPVAVVDESSHSGYPPAGMVYGGPNGGLAAPVIHYTTLSTPYKTYFSVNNTDFHNIVEFNFNRVVDGVTYASLIDVRETDDNQSIFINNNYAYGGSGYANIDKYPALVTVQFGYPIGIYNKYYTIPGEDTNLIYEGSPLITPTPTPTIPTPIPTVSVPSSGCGMNIELSLSKYANIFPYENITALLSIDDSSNLTSGSKITYVIDTFNFNSPLVIATFTNISGTWHAYKNDLGIFSDYDTTLSDALSENIRFSDAGYYTVSAYVDTPTGCYVYDTVSANINPTSQVNVDFYFRDAVSGDLVGFVAATISNVGITGNVSYYGNPIGIAASRYDNISIYCDHEGYETKFFYYTVPQPPYGNVLDVPVYLTPLEAPIIYADNTVLSVNVKSAESGEGLSNAYVSADILGVECDSGWTDGNGFVSLIVPFHSGYTLLSTGRFPYNSDSRYLSLNNATSYSVDVYLSYAGTPIVTPTPSYNYTPTLTPTTTDTPMPTSTVISAPLLYVHVWDADGGMSYPISSAIVTIYDGDEIDQTYKGAIMYTAYTDTAGNIDPLQITSNSAFWCSISKTGYYTQTERYRMTTGTESHIYVPLKRVGGNVTIATTQPTLVLPTPGGTGIQGGFIGWILDYFSEWFGVDVGTARILLALFIIMCSSVFVGGSLAGFGSGSGAGMGALIGGMFAFIAMCYVQFLPFWLLPIGIAFVGMAFFVWNRQEK